MKATTKNLTGIFARLMISKDLQREIISHLNKNTVAVLPDHVLLWQ